MDAGHWGTVREVKQMRFGEALVADDDLLEGAARAATEAVAALDGARPHLACVFVCGDDPDAVADAGRRASEITGAAAVVGCSAGGVIGGGRAIEGAASVSVWTAVLPGLELRTFHLDVLRSSDSLAVLGMPEPRPEDVVAVLLADPYTFPADGFVEQANDQLPGLPFVGGLASSSRGGAGATRLFRDGRSSSRGAVGVVLSTSPEAESEGKVAVSTIVSQGTRPIGPAMTVTAAEGNVLLGLAGAPALEKVRQVVAALPSHDQELAIAGLQIGIAMDEYAEEHGSGDFLVRGLLGADPDRGGVAIGDIVEVGRTVRLQVRDAQAADADLSALLRHLGDAEAFDPVEGALLFSCNGRGTALFSSSDHDVTTVRNVLGAAPVSGFFAAGEVGPVGGRNHLHSLSASILAFGSPPHPNRDLET
jgi:small ligand-binding sensory domain FIST